MPLPTQPITLSPEQVAELNCKLTTLRHDINNQLSLTMAALELLRAKPESGERMLAMLFEQPRKIADQISQFSIEFEQALGITRPYDPVHK